MPRAVTRPMQGIVLALGAPAGWLVIRTVEGASPAQELTHNPGLYLYLLIPTVLAFAAFGAVIGHHEDQLEESRSGLADLAVTDELTGLKNFRYFRARLAEAHAESLRESEPLSVAVVDLDDFKGINDCHGHQVGDDLLQVIGGAIAAVARAGETAARVGGEEFALLLPGVSAGDAVRIAERVRVGIKAARLVDGPAVAVTASVGTASTGTLGPVAPDDLYRAADAALYEAKRLGRDQVRPATGPQRAIPPRQTMVTMASRSAER